MEVSSDTVEDRGGLVQINRHALWIFKKLLHPTYLLDNLDPSTTLEDAVNRMECDMISIFILIR
jgi:hypothetical protein